MEVTVHTIEINTSIDKVYDISANVLKWPKYFPPCKDAKILSQEGNKQLIEITAKGNGVDFTWQSERVLYPDIFRIDFAQSKPNPLVKYMNGIWKMFETERGVLLTLEHHFEVKDNVEGLVEAVQNKEDAKIFMHKSIHKNSMEELGSIKSILEKNELEKWEANFEGEVEINATEEQVFKLLFDVKKWPELLPHCKEIVMHYEDGCNQEFDMTVVGANGKLETMRSIRQGYPNKTIGYFQPTPPPVLTKHLGKWIVTPTDNGVSLKSWHNIALSAEGVKQVLGDMEMEKALELVINSIQKNSLTTMQTIKSFLKA